MLINTIMLENYGLYKGRIEFDLRPRTKYGSHRPVVLFGGKNGAGKTTLLDAIRLAFYGRSSLGAKVSGSEYEQYLRGRIHRSADVLIQPSYSKIGVNFDYVSSGIKEVIYVERSWTANNGKGISEYLKISKNGQQIDDVSPEYWQGFIEEIIPERLSQLFFFDGEKIKNIAEDYSGNLALADSIKTLLGLDIVEKLKADLSVYSAKEVKKVASKDDLKSIEALEYQIDDAEKKRGLKREDIASLKTRSQGVEVEINNLETELYKEGNVFAGDREKHKQQKAALENLIDILGREIREKAESTFPFSLCSSVTRKMLIQIDTEQKLTKTTLARQELERVHKDLMFGLSELMPNLAQNNLEKITHVIDKTFRRYTENGSINPNIEQYLGYSETEAQLIKVWLDDAQNNTSLDMITLCDRLAQTQDSHQKIEIQLAMAPDDDQLKPILDVLFSKNNKLGTLHQEMEQKNNEVQAIENHLSTLRREYKYLISRKNDTGLAEGRLEMVRRIRFALDSYLLLLTEKKIDQLRETVVDCFNFLCRKGGILKNIDIDSKTFAVTLYDHNNAEIPKEDLSQGEKQIYAVAMLWGLGKTSGRPLPVIIDTPLARLDSDHRKNLVTNYFPNASHQVVLLSTDTEVEKELFNEMRTNISHCYHLAYNNDSKNTEVSEGYFWKESVNA